MKEKYIADLQEIKEIMNRSSRFISLSGLSGVSTGIIALAGAFLAYHLVFKDENFLGYQAVEIGSDQLSNLLLIAAGTLLLAIIAAVSFTRQKTKKAKQNPFDFQTTRLLINLLIPLVTAGLLCLMLLQKGLIGMLAPVSLIFYGLALVNGSKYTLPEIRTLGLIQIVLGLLAFQWIAYGLYFWAIGFGLVQAIYGVVIQRKY